jgi:hypothetical protein
MKQQISFIGQKWPKETLGGHPMVENGFSICLAVHENDSSSL